MNLVFATNNHHKFLEVNTMLNDNIKLFNLIDVGIEEEIPEDFFTLEENSLQKSRYVFNKTGLNCFADDTGLEISALNNEPGVMSARYAGEQKNSIDNMNKVLNNLKNITDRRARFKTVISLILNHKEYCFEGIVNGKIINKPRGKDGFGYDPIFVPDGYNVTFAEMPLSEKNKISHRGQAFTKLIEFLKNNS